MPVEPRKLHLPEREDVRFRSNFVQLAACELRFPTLLEVETKPPTAFHKALRKEYPIYAQAQVVDLGPTAAFQRENRYVFRSRRQDWAVGFRASAVSLEVTQYTDYVEFRSRLERVIAAALQVIDSDFFTRVGLRYVNAVPLREESVDGLIRNELITPLVQGVYGTVSKYWQEVRGTAPVGQYSFRHGLPGAEQKKPEMPSYVVDVDMFDDNVEAVAALPLLDSLHRQSYNFFRWAVTDDALNTLTEQTGKQQRNDAS